MPSLPAIPEALATHPLCLLTQRRLMWLATRPGYRIKRVAAAMVLWLAVLFLLVGWPWGGASRSMFGMMPFDVLVVRALTVIGFFYAFSTGSRSMRWMFQGDDNRTHGFLLLSDLGPVGTLAYPMIEELISTVLFALHALPILLWAASYHHVPVATVLILPALWIAFGFAVGGICMLSGCLTRTLPNSARLAGILQAAVFIVPAIAVNVLTGLGLWTPYDLWYTVSPLALVWSTNNLVMVTPLYWCGPVLALLALGTFCLSLAGPLLNWRERRSDVRPWKERLRDWFRRLTWYRKPPIIDNPLAWQSYVFLYGGRRTAVGFLTAGLVIWAGVAAIPWFAAEPQDRATLSLYLLDYCGLIAAVLALLYPINLCSRAFSAERQNRGALDFLFLSGLDDRDLARGKLLGVWHASRPLLLIPALYLPLALGIIFWKSGNFLSILGWLAIALPVMAFVALIWFDLLLANLLESLIHRTGVRPSNYTALVLPVLIGTGCLIFSAGIGILLFGMEDPIGQLPRFIVVTMIVLGILAAIVGQLLYTHYIYRRTFGQVRELIFEVANRDDLAAKQLKTLTFDLGKGLARGVGLYRRFAGGRAARDAAGDDQRESDERQGDNGRA